MKTIFFLLFVCTFTCSHLPASAKKIDCDKYKKKMQKYQKLQKSGNSVKRSNKLKAQEHQQFKNWQRCKQGKKVKG